MKLRSRPKVKCRENKSLCTQYSVPTSRPLLALRQHWPMRANDVILRVASSWRNGEANKKKVKEPNFNSTQLVRYFLKTRRPHQPATTHSLPLFLKFPTLEVLRRRFGLQARRSFSTGIATMMASERAAAEPAARPAKLHGRAFYESIGSPKIIVAPMVDQSEFVRHITYIPQ